MKSILLKIWILAFAAVPSVLFGRQETELDKIKFLACHGQLFYDGYTDEEVLGGAYNAWCYDQSGARVAKIHHDAPLPAFITGQFGITFTHYHDRNNDGELEDREADGFISLVAKTFPQTLDRSVPSFSGRSFVIATEIDAPEILEATGWFKGTQQTINRSNLRFEATYDDEGNIVTLKMLYANFVTQSFLRAPVEMSF
ncbi:MAG TPA: hypothetical protein VJR29_00780 [bacterium]|nr:hypothetical protein [bacterium]